MLPQIEDCVKTASVNRGASIKNLVCLGNDDKAFDGTEHPIFRVVIKTLYLADVSRAAQIDRDLLVLAEQKVLPIPYKRTCNFLLTGARPSIAADPKVRGFYLAPQVTMRRRSRASSA